MVDLHYPRSRYISENTRRLWKKMVETYCFHDNVIEKTVQNYSSTVNILCDYHKKDFTAITEKEADEFLQYLDRRVEGMIKDEKRLSVTTAFTYKKNLRSVGNYFELLLDGYKNPFKGKAVKTEQIKVQEQLCQRIQRREQVKKEDIEQLLISVKEDEAAQYYFILCMLAFFGLTSYDICTMKTNQIEYVSGQIRLHFIHRKMVPKTRIVNQPEQSKEEQEKEIYIFPKEINKEFCEYCEQHFLWQKDRRGKMLAIPRISVPSEQDNYVFYNRNHNPVNFKTISSVLKKHREKLKITYPLTTKEVSGSLISKQYMIKE